MKTASPTPLRGLFCGAGHFAKIQLTAWQSIPDARIVAVYNRTLERARALQAEFGLDQVSDDYETLLDTVRPDFVDICTAVETHLPLARAAARRGLPVLCQKPLAPRIEDAEELVRVCRQHGIRAMANDNWRWQAWYREAHRLIATGAVGSPQHARFVLRPGDGWGDAPYPLQPYFRAMERFVLLEVGGHYFDTMRFLFGEITRLHCVTRRRNPLIRGEDAAIVLLEFAHGMTALFDADRTACVAAVRPPVNGHVVIEGSEGTLRIAEDGAIYRLARNRAVEEPHAYEIPPGYRGGSVIAAQRHFIECLRSGAAFETDVSSYLAIERLVEASYRSAAAVIAAVQTEAAP
jgi:D-apiose dehydrogenase